MICITIYQLVSTWHFKLSLKETWKFEQWSKQPNRNMQKCLHAKRVANIILRLLIGTYSKKGARWKPLRGLWSLKALKWITFQVTCCHQVVLVCKLIFCGDSLIKSKKWVWSTHCNCTSILCNNLIVVFVINIHSVFPCNCFCFCLSMQCNCLTNNYFVINYNLHLLVQRSPKWDWSCITPNILGRGTEYCNLSTQQESHQGSG